MVKVSKNISDAFVYLYMKENIIFLLKYLFYMSLLLQLIKLEPI